MSLVIKMQTDRSRTLRIYLEGFLKLPANVDKTDSRAIPLSMKMFFFSLYNRIMRRVFAPHDKS
jgi:hypothetical protein